MGFHARGHEDALRPDLDAFFLKIEHRGDDSGEDQGKEAPALDELIKGQSEHVEREVFVENRIAHPESGLIQPAQDQTPRRGGRRAHKRAENQDAQPAQDGAKLGEGREVENRAFLVRLDHGELSGPSLGFSDHARVQHEQDEEDQSEDQPHAHFGQEDRPEHRSEAQAGKPQPVGVHPGEHGSKRDQHHDDPDHDPDCFFGAHRVSPFFA